MELVKIGMVISIFLIIIWIVTLNFVKSKGFDGSNHWASIVTFVLALFTTFIFFIIVPIAGPYSKTYTEINNKNIIRGENAIVLDLSNSPQKQYNDSKLFNSYKAVTEINDSTKYYLYEVKSFYGVPHTTKIIWSNYPYELFNEN